MDDLSVRLDWTQGDPVYEQIAGQIRSRIASGDLPPGFPLPPVRTLASDLGVNLNTVADIARTGVDCASGAISESAATANSPKPTPAAP